MAVGSPRFGVGRRALVLRFGPLRAGGLCRLEETPCLGCAGVAGLASRTLRRTEACCVGHDAAARTPRVACRMFASATPNGLGVAWTLASPRVGGGRNGPAGDGALRLGALRAARRRRGAGSHD